MSEPIKNIVLVGRTGNGKSTTGNTIIGEKLFFSKQQAGGVTMKCEMYRAAIQNGPVINVIDTPGLFDLTVSADIISKEIINCLTMAEEGIHAVLFVLSTRGRITQEEESTLNALQRIFGSKILDYMIVVFTGGDALEEEGQTLDDYFRDNCPEFLKKTIRLCHGRKVLFDNKTTDIGKKANQLKELVAHMADVESQTGSKPFTDNVHRKIKEENEQLEKQERDIVYKQSVEADLAEKFQNMQAKMEVMLEQLRMDHEKNMKIQMENRAKNLAEAKKLAKQEQLRMEHAKKEMMEINNQANQERKVMTQRVDAQGGNGGGSWDHGINSGIRKIYVGRDDTCISYLRVEYFSDGTVKSHAQGAQIHKPQEFVVDYPNEYITSVEGTYAVAYITAVVVTSLVFKTSTGRVSPRFGNPGFVLENNGRRLVGFHGKSGDALDAIGAHFAPDTSSSNWAPPRKLSAQGGPGGGMWDDGVHSGVRKLYIGSDGSCVSKVKFDYVSADGELETREYGRIIQHPREFLLDYPNEYITSVEGTTGRTPIYHIPVVTSLAFTTSTGRTSPTFGATKFVLEDNGRQLVGFHGRSGNVIDCIGAHFAPAPPPY